MNKAILHDHLDGGLRPSTALELAKKDSYKPLLEIENIDLNYYQFLSEQIRLENKTFSIERLFLYPL